MEEQTSETLGDFLIIDLQHHLRKNNHLTKSKVAEEIRVACKKHGFFYIVNHGIPNSVLEDALTVNANFFEMAMEMKEELISDDIFQGVRFARVQSGEFSRDFLKLYAHPLDHFVNSWPIFPPDYREKMGTYSTMIRKVAIELFGAILESLGIDKMHLQESFEEGFQMLGVNCYNTCLGGSNSKTGTPPHTDHSIITLLLQNAPGLQVIDKAGSWKNVPVLKGSLQVFVGDHLEVMSNGLYKSVLHRAVPSGDDSRLSIADFHSLGMDEIVVPAKKLENDGKNQTAYRGSSLRDYLNHLSSKDTRAFIDTVKLL